MLARLDRLQGVTGSSVDSSGRFFRVEVRDGHGAAPVPEILALLGSEARLLSDAEAGEQLAASARGDPWLGPATVMTLSYVEARILSVRISAAAAAEVPALGNAREGLAEAIRAELFATMEQVHREGGRPSGGWIYEAWPRVARAAVARCAGTLPPGAEAGLAACLPALLTC